MIAKDAQGFLFCIPSLGVAGVKSSTTAQDIDCMVGMVRSVSDIPCAIGFGVADKERGDCLRELCLARALYRLGDTVEGLGRRILESYLDDPRRAYANHARLVLEGRSR